MRAEKGKSVRQQLADNSFLRYQRQIALADFAEQGQFAVEAAKVLIVGCGGLGSHVAQSLAGAGVGVLVVADGDDLELSNLHRQVAFRESDLGCNKATALAGQLERLNSDIRVRAIPGYLNKLRLGLEVMLADLVIDCSDNFETRYAINQACADRGIRSISGAVIGWSGYVTGFEHQQENAPCYNCLFPQDITSDRAQNCTSGAVAGPAVAVIGALMALQAVKWLAGIGTEIGNRLYRLDGTSMQWSEVVTKHWSECPVCSKQTEFKPEKNREGRH